MLDITTKDNEIVLGEKAQKAVQELRNLQLQIAEAKQIEGEMKEALLKAMEEHGIKKFSNDVVTFTYVPESKAKKNVDCFILNYEPQSAPGTANTIVFEVPEGSLAGSYLWENLRPYCKSKPITTTSNSYL